MTRSSYPVRAKQHVADTAAVQLFHDQIPAEWVVRELTERDYGIDALVEISTNGFMLGRVIAVQIKGDARLTLADRARLNYTRLARSTLNYLNSLPVPSYLFVASSLDQKVYWACLPEHQRGDSGETTPRIELRTERDLSEPGLLILQLTELRERRWPQIEAAVVGALGACNGLGPLYLACKRAERRRPAPSTVQFLLTQHYEFNALLQRYVCRMADAPPPSLSEIYTQAVNKGQMTSRGVFTVGFVHQVFDSFLTQYIDAIEVCHDLVCRSQRSYWMDQYPYLVLHLDAFPPLFNLDDWASRYHFDEYENETAKISLDLFEDMDEHTRRVLSGDW